MALRFSRRKMMQSVSGVALAQSVTAAEAAPAPRKWPIEEGPDTPKICLAPGDGGGPLPASVQPAAPAAAVGRGGGYGGYLAPKAEAPAAPPLAAFERIRQLGVTHLLGVAISGSPWTEENVRRTVQTAKDAGLVAYNAMINLPASVIYGRETRSKDMEPFLASLAAAGKGGLQVVEYNFYAHRAIEGYYETVGRAGAGYTGFDSELELLINENGGLVQPVYRDEKGQITPETLAAFPNAKKVKFKDLPPLANEGAHNLQEIWANITWFLKLAVPAAEKAGIRLALHPNDPPAPISRGSQQIMGTVAGWKHLIEIVNSPANGITFDCGVTREMGEDPVATGEYFASRKRINHVHYRNVQVVKPYERYQEVFIDAGMADMFGVMKALIRNKYTGTIYPEHPRALDADRDRVAPGGRLPGYPGGGGYTGITYSVAYTRAMMQAALESVG
ncbi:MAG TPA: mannonate dehydratase [Candidatus Sulfopaludibacter sp.]|jgi:mannonate dehydratase|nr:mannonate dehydratase [Candidatus Sulfopaludibacter sp.]